MHAFRFARWSTLLVASVLTQPAFGLSTTYTWGSEDGVRWDGINYGCTEEPQFAVEFPELCSGPEPALLTVDALHYRPIWDNDASGCDPSVSQRGCSFTSLVGFRLITLSGVAEIDPSEVTSFYGADFLGPCPIEDCEIGAPFITFDAVDTATGIAISVADHDSWLIFELHFPDGRRFDDPFAFWVRGPTLRVPEPGTLSLLVLGLIGLGTSSRRRS